MFLAVWGPILLFFLGGARIFLRKDGTYPKWYATFTMAIFTGCWASYDGMFKDLFGDGERTIGDKVELEEPEGVIVNEKTPLLVEQTVKAAV